MKNRPGDGPVTAELYAEMFGLKGLFRSKPRKKRVLVVGLDGVSCSLLKEYMDRGYLPCISRVLSDGHILNQMDASIPDVSSTSWTSFMTGVNPGEHGIYGFMELRSGSYSLYFPNSFDIKAPAFWDILGNTMDGKTSTLSDRYAGKVGNSYRSIVINVPQTYPARPLNGILTAGFVALDLSKATYPESAYRYLDSIGYIIDVNAELAKDRKDLFFQELARTFERRGRAIDHFFLNEEWDLFIATITETDRLHHFFYDAAFDTHHPYHSHFVEFYRDLDRFVGRLYERFMDMSGGEGLFMTMSDHGFSVLEKEVYINNYLRDAGLLRIDDGREFFEKIDYGTKAFALDPARIYIHTRDRYPRGEVDVLEREKVIEEVKEALLSLEDGGRKVLKEIYTRDVLYKGPFVEKAPDLVCLPFRGYDLKASLQKQGVFGREHFTGMHVRDDAHCILPERIEVQGRLHVEGLAGIILDYFSS